MSKFQEKLKSILDEEPNIDKIVVTAEKKATTRVNAQISLLESDKAEVEVEMMDIEEDLEIIKYSENFNCEKYLSIMEKRDEVKEKLETLERTIETWKNLLEEWK